MASRAYCRCDASVGTEVVDGGLILCSECGNVRPDPLLLLIAKQQRQLLERIDRLEGTRGGGPEDEQHIEEKTGLVDPAELARRLGRNRGWVYDHADELGAIRLGEGPRPRLYFDLTQVPDRLAALAARNGAAKSKPKPPRRRRQRKASTPMLPVKGRAA